MPGCTRPQLHSGTNTSVTGAPLRAPLFSWNWSWSHKPLIFCLIQFSDCEMVVGGREKRHVRGCSMDDRSLKKTVCSTSNLWPNLISPSVNKHEHSQTWRQQAQQAQRRQSEEPAWKRKNKWAQSTFNPPSETTRGKVLHRSYNIFFSNVKLRKGWSLKPSNTAQLSHHNTWNVALHSHVAMSLRFDLGFVDGFMLFG